MKSSLARSSSGLRSVIETRNMCSIKTMLSNAFTLERRAVVKTSLTWADDELLRNFNNINFSMRKIIKTNFTLVLALDDKILK